MTAHYNTSFLCEIGKICGLGGIRNTLYLHRWTLSRIKLEIQPVVTIIFFIYPGPHRLSTVLLKIYAKKYKHP